MPHKLLFIEDDLTQEAAIKGYYRQYIKEGKYQVIIAHSGEEAIEILQEDKNRSIDIIIADLKMPSAKIDGWNFVKILTKKQIKIKTIVYTAYGSELDFTEEENENIVFFLDREKASLEFLKEVIDFALKLPQTIDHKTTKVHYRTLLKLAKEFPAQLKKKLVQDLIEYLDYHTLLDLKASIFDKIEEQLEPALARDRLKHWMLLKQEEGTLDKDIPLHKIDYFSVEARLAANGIYYYWLRWWEDGKLRGKYLSKDLANTLPLEYKTVISYPKKS
jgi:CheY-like chemotaxis protein